MKKGKAKLLTDTDVKNCIHYIDVEMKSPRNHLMFYFMLMTALRIHSIQKLTIGQVYKDGYIPVDSFLLQPEQNKGHKKSLQVYINSKLKQELKVYAKYLKDNEIPYRATDYLFPSNKGGCLSKQQIIHIFRTIFNGVGLDKQYRVHSLRATCLTNLMNKNYPLALIQQISGHSSINTLSIYYRSNPQNIQNALESLVD